MLRCAKLTVLGCVLGLTGCVMVNPSNVSVLGSPGPAIVPEARPTIPRTPYGEALERVMRQEERVVKQLHEQDWKDLAKESAEWTRRIRTLSGYADTSADPSKFRHSCDRMLQQTQVLQDGALHYDAAACQDAINTIDPLLNQFARDFPVVVPLAATAPRTTAVPSPTRQPAPQRSASPTRVP